LTVPDVRTRKSGWIAANDSGRAAISSNSATRPAKRLRCIAAILLSAGRLERLAMSIIHEAGRSSRRVGASGGGFSALINWWPNLSNLVARRLAADHAVGQSRLKWPVGNAASFAEVPVAPHQGRGER
jgi:hypothetical protein